VLPSFIALTSDAATAEFQDSTASMASLKRLSIQELLNTEITPVRRAEEPLSEAAAAVYVITRDDILPSGLQSGVATTSRATTTAR
jgi:outer membrane cobalamin receptor